MKDDFKLFIPFDITKSTEIESDGEEMRIAGYASTDAMDREGDEILQRGLDISNFVNYGWFNFDHDNSKIVGYPDKSKCRVTNKGFYVEGVLIKGVKLAEDIWNTVKALRKSNAPRKFGFSIEGKVQKRDEVGKILKAKVYNVAVTANPVNTTCTFDALCKSFSDKVDNNIDINTMKALEAGYTNALIPEELDSALKVIVKALEGDNSNLVSEKLRDILKIKKSLSNDEQMIYLQLCKGLSKQDAKAILDNTKGD